MLMKKLQREGWIKILFLICLVGSGAVFAQNRMISGTVTDAETGEPIPGVNVLQRGTTNGTTTDIDGRYQFSVPENGGYLVFTNITYLKQEVEIGSRSVINIKLSPNVKQLEEIVVTGYGEVDRKRMTGSISSISGKTIENVPVPSFDQILQGQTPGVLVTAGSGQPGAAARIRIRGNSSINGNNEPLIVVDGVPVNSGVTGAGFNGSNDPFATINPMDIEDVAFLKDAVATAIYGSRGANGVLVITTKRGKKGPAEINYSFQTGFSNRTRPQFDMMNASERIDYELDNLGAVGGQVYTEGEIDSLKSLNTNWSNEFFRQAPMQSHDLSIKGGNENTRYFFSASYLDQEGIQYDSEIQRITTRLNVDQKLNDKMRVGNTFTVGFTNSSFIDGEEAVYVGNPVVQAFLNLPYEPVFDPLTGEFNNPAFGFNALEEVERNDRQEQQLKLNGTLYYEYNITDWLRFKSVAGVDYDQGTRNYYYAPGTYLSGVEGDGTGNSFRGYLSALNVNFTNTLNANFDLGNQQELNVLLGQEIFRNQIDNFTLEAQGFASDKLRNVGSAGDPTGVNGFNTGWALSSFFSKVDYSLAEKYFLTASYRVDGSSRFGAENRWAGFYSVGANWSIVNEEFMRNARSFLNDLRIRASYGTQGNQPAGNFPSLGLFGFTGTYANTPASQPNTIANPNLQWEKQNAFNTGIDVALFNDRLSLTADFYNNVTTDLIIERPVSATTGFDDVFQNVGSMRNRGLELALTMVTVQTENVSWTISPNITFNRNTILELPDGEDIIDGVFVIREGEPFNTFFYQKYAGVNPANGEPLYYNENGSVTNIQDDAESVPLGNFDPNIFGGITSNLDLGPVNIFAFFSFAGDFYRLNNVSFFTESNGQFMQYNQSTLMLNAWQQPGDRTPYPVFGSDNNFSSYHVQNSSFMRLRNLRITYRLPVDKLNQNIIDMASIFVQGQNLLTFTNYRGLDPEGDDAVDGFEYPVARIITGGINIKF